MFAKKENRYAILALLFALGVAGWLILMADYSGTKTVYAQGRYVEPLEEIKSPFTDVVDAVMPCVVGVSNLASSYSIVGGQTQMVEQATGSGVVITTDGHVVTNYHVVEGAGDVQVLWQGQYLKAEVVGIDELTDLAVLRVTENVELSAVRMGDPTQVNAGDWAIVIGNPLGKQFADTVTVGVISAVDRELDETAIVKMIQTDAAINSGNSGGGLFNTRGELIGIPSLKFSASGRDNVASIEGIAMAIPMDVVQPVVSHLIQYGKVNQPKLGISVLTLRGSREPTRGMLPAGVYVSAVQENSAAKIAGIQTDDIILSVDGERITMHTDLMNRIAMKASGDQVTLTICRIPGLSELTLQDRIPEWEIFDVTVTLRIPGEAA